MRIVDFELSEPVPFGGCLVRRRADAPMRDPTVRESVVGVGHNAPALVLAPETGDQEMVWVPLANVRWWSTRVE
jgi:hypothetical protein